MRAFVGQVTGFSVRGEYTTVTVESPSDQLGRAVNLLEYTGVGGAPKPIALRILGREDAGRALEMRAWLKQFRVNRDGDFVIVFTAQDEFDIEKLRSLLDRGVAVGYGVADATESQDNTNDTPDTAEEE